MSPTTAEVQELLREIQRYLTAVDTFREECCEPQWSAEASCLAEPA